MDAFKPASISPQELYQMIGTDSAPLVIDVRRGPAFAADDRMVVGAISRNPDEVKDWRERVPAGRRVIVYCVHGHEVSQQVALALHSSAAGILLHFGGVTQ